MPRLPRKMKQFCDEQELLRLAYVDSDGYPRVVPVWFIRMGENFVIGTEVSSPKWQSISKHPQVGWVVDGGTSPAEYTGVSFRGIADEVTENRLHRRAFRALGMKYFGSTEHRTFRELYAHPGSILILLRPEQFFAWDYSD